MYNNLRVMNLFTSIKPAYRKFFLHLVSLSVIVAYALIVTAPALQNCSTTILGAPGDGTSGGIWSIWQYHTLDSPPWASQTPYLSAPYGESLWNPVYVSFIFNLIAMWLLGTMVNAVCAWNLWVLFGFILSGFIAYGFGYWLLRKHLLALFIGFGYAFSPYHIEKATGHINYLHSWPLILSLWALFVLYKKPSTIRAILFGASVSLLAYTDGYYILIGPIMLISALTPMIYLIIKRGKIKEYVKPIIFSFLSALIFVLPFVYVYASSKSATEQFLGASRPNMYNQLIVWANRLPEIVIPPIHHTFLGGIASQYWKYFDHGSNPSEQTIYLGLVVILLSGLSIFALLRKRITDIRKEGIFIFTCIALTTFVISILPSIGIDINGRAIYPFAKIFGVQEIWRVFARFYLVFQFAFLVLAAYGIKILSKKYRAREHIVAIVGLIILAIEYLMIPVASWNYSQAPRVYDYVKNTPSDIVAEYPLNTPPDGYSLGYMTYQYIHGKKLFNSGLPNGTNSDLYPVLDDLTNPNTSAILSRLGVVYIILHPDIPNTTNTHFNDTYPGLDKVYVAGQDIVYKVNSSQPKTILMETDGFYKPEKEKGEEFSWMGEDGELKILSFSEASEKYNVTFKVQSFGFERTLSVVQDGKVLGVVKTNTDTDYEKISVSTNSKSPIHIFTDKPAVMAPKPDSRLLSLRVIDLAFQAIPAN